MKPLTSSASEIVILCVIGEYQVILIIGAILRMLRGNNNNLFIKHSTSLMDRVQTVI